MLFSLIFEQETAEVKNRRAVFEKMQQFGEMVGMSARLIVSNFFVVGIKLHRIWPKNYTRSFIKRNPRMQETAKMIQLYAR